MHFEDFNKYAEQIDRAQDAQELSAIVKRARQDVRVVSVIDLNSIRAMAAERAKVLRTREQYTQSAAALGWEVVEMYGEKCLVYTATGLYFPLAAIFEQAAKPADVPRGAFNEWELTRGDYDDARTWEQDAAALDELARAWEQIEA